MDFVHSGQAALTNLISTTVRWGSTTAKSRPFAWPVYHSLPVAGIDVLTAQTVLYSILRISFPADQGAETVEAWLQTLQLAQITSDRLLESLNITHQHLSFWKGRLKAGSHGSFMLLSRGPTGFVRELGMMLHELTTAWSTGHVAQSQPPPAAAAGGQSSERTPSDRIEERVIALQLLFSKLAKALSAIHGAAALLKLCGDTPAAATLGGAAAGGQLPQGATLQEYAISAVHDCLSGVRETLEQLLPELEQLQQYDTAVRQVQQAVTSAAQLGIKQQRQQQQQAPAAAKLTSIQLQQQLLRVCELLHVQENDLRHGVRRGDAGAALSSASTLAVRLGPLVQVPAWSLRPSTVQRHWIRYSIAAAAGLSAAAFLYRHSRLAGSSDLDDWAAAAASAVKGAWADHVVSPLVVVRDELFSTFRDRPSIVSNSEFEADKESLLRMLADFQHDHPAAAAVAAAINTTATPAPSVGPAVAAAAAAATGSTVQHSSSSSLLVGDQLLNDSDAVNKGMQVVMRCYERDLKSPIRNLVTGELARTLLIQVQRLKLDTEAAMLELDQILRANELSISLVAAVPALLLSWALLRGVWVLLAPRPPDPKREAMPCRLAMADLARALSELARAQSPDAGSSAAATQQQQQQQKVAAAEGVVLYRLYRVYREAQMLYRLKDKTSRYSEWPYLQSDLLMLVQPAVPASAKLDLQGTMSRTYTVLKP